MRYLDLKVLTIQSHRRKIIFDFILTNEDKVNYNFKLLFLYNNSVSMSKIKKHQQYFFQIDTQSYSHSNIKISDFENYKNIPKNLFEILEYSV